LSQYSAQDELIAANRSDVQSAYASGLSPSMIDRLSINHARISGLIEMIRRVRTLADPVGSIDGLKLCASGIRVGKMKVPLGVVLMIYESRPSATLESACLCIKSANAVILKGGKEAAETNGVLVSLIKRALSDADLPDQAVMFIERQEHEYLYELLRLKDFISVVIPRGGEGLIESIMERSRIPVLCHAKGVCHIYVCSDADLDSALNIIINSKVQRAGVCNAAECILVDESIATKFIPTLVSLLNSHGVLVRACNKSMTHLKGEAPDKVQRAASGDFGREFLSLGS
ncbi:MAG: glutamate-5-semialdehyde dehydrogenase, partial [Proteobacteria bacterium]